MASVSRSSASCTTASGLPPYGIGGEDVDLAEAAVAHLARSCQPIVHRLRGSGSAARSAAAGGARWAKFGGCASPSGKKLFRVNRGWRWCRSWSAGWCGPVTRWRSNPAADWRRCSPTTRTPRPGRGSTRRALAGAGLVLSVQPVPTAELEPAAADVATCSFFPTGSRIAEVAARRDRGVTTFAMELVPRISRAQPMDALSSQAMVVGYRGAVVAAGRLRQFFPLSMTAAGTVRPAEVLVLGAGVAGLQAIATARTAGGRGPGLRRARGGRRGDRLPRSGPDRPGPADAGGIRRLRPRDE